MPPKQNTTSGTGTAQVIAQRSFQVRRKSEGWMGKGKRRKDDTREPHRPILFLRGNRSSTTPSFRSTESIHQRSSDIWTWLQPSDKQQSLTFVALCPASHADMVQQQTPQCSRVRLLADTSTTFHTPMAQTHARASGLQDSATIRQQACHSKGLGSPAVTSRSGS